MELINSFRGEYRFLSNFFFINAPVIYQGLEFHYTENAYVAAKTIDRELQLKIQSFKPGQAKFFGQNEIPANLKNPMWSDSFRLELMLNLVQQKFFKNAELAELLLRTGNVEIIEGNDWHDNFFGICNCGCCPFEKASSNPQNHLGKILKEIRAKLKGRL